MEEIFNREKYFFPLFLVLLTALILFAWLNAFIQDDAFISFRYAANLVNGYGLVWNPGERVEGYTNFLWTLIMAVPHALGFGPVIFSKLMGFIFFTGTLLVAFQCARDIFKSRLAAWTSMLLLGANYTFSAYATGGLETQLQTLLVTLGFWFCMRIVSQPNPGKNRLFFSLACGFAILTRLDSALPFVILYLTVLIKSFQGKQRIGQEFITEIIQLTLPAALLVTPWLVWKLFFYGSLLPNSFYVKAASPNVDVFWQGVRYLFLFLQSYWLLPFILLALITSRRWLRIKFLWLAVLVSLLWKLYVIGVGGDFMEFRFLVPILPLFFILITAAIKALQPILVQALLTVIILLGSWHHSATFINQGGVESIRSLEAHVMAPAQNWMGIGLRLNEYFADVEEMRIATTAAGAIPYYSGLYSIDMHGLNDAWVARHGLPIGIRPGHRRIAPLSYLLDRRVNLVIGHPIVLPRGIRPADHPAYQDWEIWTLLDVDDSQLKDELLIVEIPLDSIYTLSTVYLVRDEQIDRIIRDQGWVTYPIQS